MGNVILPIELMLLHVKQTKGVSRCSITPCRISIRSKASVPIMFAALPMLRRILWTVQWFDIEWQLKEHRPLRFSCAFWAPASPLALTTLITFCSPAFPHCGWLTFEFRYSLPLFFLFSCRCSTFWAMKSFNNPWQMSCSISFRSSIHCSVSWPWSWWKS